MREAACELPAFVRIGGGNGFANTSNGGFLGTEFDAFVVGSADRPPENVALTTPAERYQRRLQLIGRLESLPGSNVEKGAVYDHRKLYENASRMVLSPQMQAFDLSKESEKTRAMPTARRNSATPACWLAG